MSKKMMLLALATACAAMFALPAVASAGTWKIDPAGYAFTVSGGTGTLTAETIPGGSTQTVTCTGTAGTGAYSAGSQETGTMTLTFTGCKSLGANCTSGTDAAGTITATGHFTNVQLKKASTTTPGITITGPGGSTTATLSSFVCGGLIPVTVTGSINGHLEAGCDTSEQLERKIEFASGPTEGEVLWPFVTEDSTKTKDDLTVVSAGTTRTGSIDATGTIKGNAGAKSKVTC